MADVKIWSGPGRPCGGRCESLPVSVTGVDARAGLDSTFASLTRLVPRIPPGASDLVVMPEVVLRIFPRAEIHRGWLEPLLTWSGYAEAPILFGALGYRGDLGGSFTPFNSAFLIEPDGLTDYEYDKRYLVPFVERVPLLPPEWFGRLDYFGGFFSFSSRSPAMASMVILPSSRSIDWTTSSMAGIRISPWSPSTTLNPGAVTVVFPVSSS